MTTLPILPQPPIADTVSEAARIQLAPMIAAAAQPMPDLPVAALRQMAEAMTAPVMAARLTRYGGTVAAESMGGVPVQLLRPKTGRHDDDRLLINLHGGGFVVDSGSLTESIPIAALTGIPVAAVLYRLAPEHPYPAAVEDALAVYRAALERHRPDRIALFGTSAGAILSVQLLARLKHEGLPMPAALGFFSGTADLARAGDCEGYLPPLPGGRTIPDVLARYAGAVDRRDPLLSPLFGDLTGLPPTLSMASTRDQLLSQTVLFDLALRRAGVPSELIVYDGLPHAFWAGLECPETDAALAQQAAFLARHLG